jgi:hypothetical protein
VFSVRLLKGPVRQIRRAAQETAETALKEGAEKALRQGGLTAENLEKLAKNRITENSLVGRVLGKLNQYPQVLDTRTGRTIQFPSGIEKVVPQAQRVSWGAKERGEFIGEWYRRGYETPRGGWDKYDIHHIKPREFGGTNEFWNLTPVLRGTHQEAFNSFWREFAGL